MGIGGPKEKFRNNMAAVNLLHELEFDNRLATPEEQKILSKYVGFGGLADAFDESKEAWSDEYKELIVTLSPDEYAAARESTLTAFTLLPLLSVQCMMHFKIWGSVTVTSLNPRAEQVILSVCFRKVCKTASSTAWRWTVFPGGSHSSSIRNPTLPFRDMKKHHSPTAFLMLRSAMFRSVSLRLLIRNMTRIIG